MHTQSTLLELLPFHHLDGGITKKILVRPDEDKAAYTNEDGIIIPEGAGKTMERGTVIAVCADSLFKQGEKVAYRIIPRGEVANPVNIDVEGVLHHLLLEDEIWDVEDTPVNRVYIKSHSGVTVTEEGILAPEDALGILQYGTVFRTPRVSIFKEGDVVGYRRNEQEAYPTAVVDGTKVDILFERDVFVVNDVVAPSRITVQINTIAQRANQAAQSNGILLHPSFIHMKRNLQYARVKEIGEKAAEMYPNLEAGDYVAIHHSIEHHAYRLMGVKRGATGHVTGEYRTINCFSHFDNEIFAKLIVGRSPSSDNLEIKEILPYGDIHFFEWKFDVLTEGSKETEVLNTAFDVSKFRDLEQMRAYIDSLKGQATEQYKLRYGAITTKLQRLNPEIQEQKNMRDECESQIEELKRGADAIGRKLGRNFLVACKIIAPNEHDYTHIVTSYKELYPISLFGKKYLIGYKHFILGYLKSKHNMALLENFVPTADRVLVEAIPTDTNTEILVPKEMIMDRPDHGVIVKVGPGTEKIQMLGKPGDTVWFRKGQGIPMHLDGKDYLLFRQNEDLLGVEKSA
jgi:co-chaperonin GroES (HSP10)